MFVIKLVLKNSLRHTLRTVLTIIGVSIAVMSFGFMRTIVTAWSAGVQSSAENRMITRQSVSFIFPLPYSCLQQIQQIPGVTEVSYANWFGGVYKDAADWKNFFPRIAVDPETYFSIYPEFIVPADQFAEFKKERNACIVGEKLAQQHGFKLGDLIPIEGDIYPGRWEFVVRGIYRGKDQSTDLTQMFFHWDYLNERMHVDAPGREGLVGWYILNVHNAADMPRVAKAVDDRYLNSRSSTKTETEREFQQSFVSMSSAIISSLEAVSYVIIGIILLVLANTIVMAARERTKEYAVLKTLGFSARHIVGLIAGESMLIASTGCVIGLALTFPMAMGFANVFPTFFPVFNVETVTIILAVAVALFAGVVAALFPATHAVRMKIVDGLRSID
jgi:putative ABC transport system permease protein